MASLKHAGTMYGKRDKDKVSIFTWNFLIDYILLALIKVLIEIFWHLHN